MSYIYDLSEGVKKWVTWDADTWREVQLSSLM